MEYTIKPPAPLSNNGDTAENWMRWKKDFTMFIELSDYKDKSQDIKAYLLRNYIGEFGQSVIQKIVFENINDRDNMQKLMTKLDAHFNPINEVMARHLFFTKYKQRNESIEDHISDLKKKAKICNFGNLTNSLIRDHIIAHLNDQALKKKLLEVRNLDLPKLVTMYKEHIATKTQKQVSSGGIKQNEADYKCWRCNVKHPKRKCPAWNSKCENCGQFHHFTSCCKENNLQKKKTTTTNIHNPNEYVYGSNTNLRTGTIQHANIMNTEALHPSAPSQNPSVQSQHNNQLYPSLNLGRTAPWAHVQNESIQRSAVMPSAPAATSTSTEGKKKESCIVS